MTKRGFGSLVGWGVLGVASAVAAAPGPVAQWAFPEGRDVPATAHLGIVAYHQGGVSSVVFSVNSSPVATVTNETINPDTEEMEFVLTLDTTSYTENTWLTVDAVVHAVPAGAPALPLPSRTVFVDNAPTHATWYVSGSGSDSTGDGSSGSPYATINKAASVASSGDEVRVRDGNYYLGINADYGFTRYVRILPDTTASPVITNSETIRSGFLHFEGLTFDWSSYETNRPDGGYYGVMITPNKPNIWVENCTFSGPPDSYNFEGSAVNPAVGCTNLLVEDCLFSNVLRAVVCVPGTIARGNDIGPITSDAFDFFSEVLLTGNRMHDIFVPHLRIQTTNAETYNVSGAGGLTFVYDEFNSGTYTNLVFPDVGALVSSPTSATAADLGAGFMSDADFSNKMEATSESGYLRVTARRSNYYQHLYVTGACNTVLGFPNTNQSTEAWGSGMHADIFQTWGSCRSNIIIRNNYAYDHEAQCLLIQADTANFAFVNNLMRPQSDNSWLMRSDGYNHTNAMYVHNTFWGTRNVLILPTSGYTDFMFVNNILGPRGVAGDTNDTEMVMDYNCFDYYAPATGEGPAANSLWTNPSKVQPSPSGLFSGVTATYNAETGYYDYSAPNGDFSLRRLSPARNEGTDACGIDYDIDWQERDSAPDMGAFEYVPGRGLEITVL